MRSCSSAWRYGHFSTDSGHTLGSDPKGASVVEPKVVDTALTQPVENIARELHDTLQSFHGLMFRLQAARNMLPRRPAEAMQALDGAITRAEQAIAEGRGAIQDLRAEPAAQSDLAHLLTAMGQELAGSEDGNGDSPVFGVTVEGAPQTLDPILQDEIYRIAREALRNAFRHARAGRIEAEIRYDERGLRLRIRDDGKGIDPELLKAGGRAGHWVYWVARAG